MSAVADRIDVAAVIPDGIEPVEMHRVWRFIGGKLRSLNSGEAWEPGEPFAANCRANDGVRDFRFVLVPRGGMTLEKAQAYAPNVYRGTPGSGLSVFSFRKPVYGVVPPLVAPPQGCGYALEEVASHASPDANCSCGIYAAAETSHGYTGDVAGKVKLWGKIVPGDKGARAQYAYPSELHVPAALANDPGILAYGVPVVIVDATAPTALSAQIRSDPLRRIRNVLHLFIALNIGAMLFNLLAGFKVI